MTGPLDKPARDPMMLVLAAYAASLPFQTLGARPLFGHPVFLSELVFLACVAVAIPVGLARRWWRRVGGLELWAGVYLLAAVLATVGSEAPAQSAAKLAGVGYLVALAAIAHLALDTPSKRRLLVSVWLAVGAVSAVASIAGGVAFYLGLDPASNPFQRHYGSLPPGPYPRMGAFFFNVNMYCNYLIVTLALAWERWAERPRWWPYGLLVAGLGAAALLTASTGLGGVLLVAGLMVWRQRPERHGASAGAGRRRWVLVAALAGAAIILPLAAVAPTDAGELEPSMRALTWKGALETLLRHPLTGKGLGLPVADVEFRVPQGRTIHFTDGHNVWLNFGAQAGVAGLVALAGLVGWALRRGLRAAAAGDGGPSPAVLAIALLGALLYHGLTGSFEDARHLWLLLGLLAASLERPRDAALGSGSAAV